MEIVPLILLVIVPLFVGAAVVLVLLRLRGNRKRGQARDGRERDD